MRRDSSGRSKKSAFPRTGFFRTRFTRNDLMPPLAYSGEEKPTMAVSQKDRDEYEEGRSDREKGALEQVYTDVFVKHPDSAAYYKGREGEQLDADKKEEKKDD